VIGLTFVCSIDVNTIETYQQSFIYVFCMLTTPIFINTCVVRIRLHWFEKRFENIGEFRRWELGNRVTSNAHGLVCSRNVSHAIKSTDRDAG
jgi:hypothetical protein